MTSSKNILLEIPPNAVQAIRAIYNLDKQERLDEALDLFEAWIKKQDHILKKDFCRGYLEIMLITSKGSIEKAKSKLDKMCTLRTLLPHFFGITNVKVELQHLLDVACMVPLPKLTEDYCRVMILKIYNNQFTGSHLLDLYRYCITISEYIIAHDYCDGFIIICDFLELDLLKTVSKINAMELHQMMTILTKGFGARLRGIHISTNLTIVDTFLKMIKPFFSQKMSGRLHALQSLQNVHQVVPKNILPVDYGGTERAYSELKDLWIEEISSPEFVQHMKMMNKARTDETLRLSAKFNEDIMGMPGSFRHLCVD